MRELSNAEISPLAAAIERQNADEVQRLLTDYGHTDVLMAYGRTSLHHAAEKNCDRIAEILIKNGADMQARGCFGARTPLQVAIESSSLETLRKLLNAGAQVNALSASGRTTLHFALRHIHSRKGREMLDLILRHKPDVNVADEDGITPADMAIDYGEEADLAALLTRGADPNARIRGQTRLHRLAQGGLPVRYFQLLIEWGADIHARDDQGRLPLDIAKERGRDGLILQVLSEQHGDERPS